MFFAVQFSPVGWFEIELYEETKQSFSSKWILADIRALRFCKQDFHTD